MIENITKKIIADQKMKKISLSIVIILFIFLIAQSVFSIFQFHNFKKTALENDNLANDRITIIEDAMTIAREENLTLREALDASRERYDALERSFRRVNSNVRELEKLTKTDPQLLQKYSKVYFLNEHYAPSSLSQISRSMTYDKNKKYEILGDVHPFLENMIKEAQSDGLDLLVISAFRSYGEQSALKSRYTVTYGAGSANQFSADQGYSEHQLGTAVDFTTSAIGANFESFAQTPEYTWLKKNAHRHGFTLSYPENNQYYIFEPWHWRFVGVDLATYLYKNDMYFYDMSQREIDQYIVNLFD